MIDPFAFAINAYKYCALAKGSHLFYALKIFIFIIAYFALGKFGMELNSVNAYASLVWPPTGIALSFLLIFGVRHWPAIFIAATLINISFQAPIAAAIGIGIGNTLESVFAVLLMRRLGFDRTLSNLRDAILLILIGAAIAPLLSTTVGVSSLWFFDAISTEQYQATWQTWWAGNFLAILIVAPLILSWTSFFKLKQKIKNKSEAGFVAFCLMILFALLFSDDSKPLGSINLQLPFLIFPFVIWSALRFRQIGASTVTFLISICALWGAGYNYGPFAFTFPQGNVIFIHTFLAVLAITGMVVASMTTERAQTKAVLRNTLFELEKRGDQLDAILRGINDSITVIDQNDQYVYTNEIAAKSCGFASVDEMLNCTATDVLNKFEIMDENGEPLPYEKLPHNLALAGQNNPPEVVVRFRVKGQPEEKWSIVKSNAIVNHKTKARFAVSVFKDFTERKRIEDSIKYLDEASHVFNSSLDYEETLAKIAKMAVPRIADWCSIDIIRPGDKKPHTITVQHINPTKLQFAEDLISKYPPDWNSDTGSARVLRGGPSVLHASISDELIKKNSQNEEHYRMITSLGLRSAMIVPIRSRGKIFGVISLYSAESGRIYTQADLIFAEELARRGGMAIDNALLFAEMEKLAEDAKNANQIKSLFLANMSHEIRTPLGAILGFNALMNDSHITDNERRRYSEIITRNGQQLTQLIDDILDLSKVEAGRLDIEILEVALPSLITDITSLMNQKAKEKGLFLTVLSEGSTPPIIYTDPTRLRQILLNIIGNAIKFTAQGGVKVVLRTEPENSSTPNKITIQVEDTGTGIPKENQSRLFEWFTQADASTTRKFGGTGLGLALSRRLARALKGDVVLNESSNKGSSFVISIANQINEYKSQPQTNLEKPLNIKDLGNSELKGLRVLLAEDSADNRTLIECILGQRGAIIDSAENGLEAVKKALKEDYDLVLMDIQMPLYDGLQATKELREKGYQKPIVALTAHAMKEEREKTLSMGCNAHLTKPIEIPKLLNIVAELGQHHH